MLGFTPYTFDTPIAGGKIRIDAPSYEQFPTWVVGTAWPAATFVSTEGNEYTSSEGIYDWTPADVGIGYLFGWDDYKRPTAYSTIPIGLRGEYRTESNTPPNLYISPVDNRLHLLNATDGLWNVLPDGKLHPELSPLTNKLALHTLNLGGSSYVNGWYLEQRNQAVDTLATPPATSAKNSEPDPTALPTPETTGKLREALYALNGYLVYANAQDIEIQKADYTLGGATMLPPVDTATWKDAQAKLATYSKRDPLDIHSWLSVFPSSTTMTLRGAHLSDVRATSDGFRFVLRVDPDSHSEGTPLFGDAALAPGSYVVTNTKSGFTFAPLTPPALSATIDASSLLIQQRIPLQVTLRNGGSADLSKATFQLWGTSPKGDEILIASRSVSVPGNSATVETINWAAPSLGQWTLTPKLFDTGNNNQPFALGNTQLTIASAPPVAPMSILTDMTSDQTFILSLTLAFTLTIFFGICAVRFWRIPITESADDQ